MLDLRVNSRSQTQLSVVREDPLLPPDLFMRMLCLERRRSDRSGRRFVLMLLDPGNLLTLGKQPVVPRLFQAVAQSVRDTDLKGWYNDGTIGVIFTEVGS